MWATKRPASPGAAAAAAAAGPTKKLVIRGLGAVPTLPPTYKADTLARLRAAVGAVHQGRATAQGLEELYRDCEGLCLHRFAADAYEMLQAELQAHVRRQLQAIDARPDASPDGSVLELARRFWDGYTQQLAMIRCIFLYLDRTYALQTPGVAPLWAMGLVAVRSHLDATPMRARLVRLFAAEVTRERDGHDVDRAALASVAGMFAELDLYAQSLAPGLLAAARDYYQREAARLVAALAPVRPGPAAGPGGAMDVPRYLAHVQRRLADEARRATQYLRPESQAPLVDAVRAEMVERHADALLGPSLDAMLDADMVPDLAALYALLAPVGRLGLLQQRWGAYIRSAGMRVMQAPDLDATLVPALLDLKRRLDAVLAGAFQADAQLASAMREAFEAFINTRRSRPAQLIARHADHCLRMGARLAAGSGGDEADDADAVLSRIIVLFRFVQGKDLFEAFYRRDLAKRLLASKTASIDTERLMLQKLKAECGAGYTNRLEGMLRDVDLAPEPHPHPQPAADIGFHATVLTMAYWPAYDPIDLVLPAAAEQAQERFAAAYKQAHPGRSLLWQHTLGSCVLSVDFDEGPKELQLSLVQAAVLLLFAAQDVLSYSQIQQSTGLDGPELQRTLQSLACGKFRVLTKEPRGRDVAATDSFTFNAAFKSPQARVKISQIAPAKEAEKDKDLEEHVHLDRMYRVDAALVRIMKARRTIEHAALVTELLAQLSFAMSPAEVKERIEVLLERDYMRRDDASTSTYHYIA